MLTANRFIPLLSIHPGEIYLYYEPVEKTLHKYYNESSMINLQNNRVINKLSLSSKKKVKRAINYLLYLSREKTAYNHKTKSTFKFKLNFITLTLPSRQQHDDNTIKSVLLNQFLIEAKAKWNLTRYVWKAERQKNGNIHFHILSDCFIPWQEGRNVWNRICNKLHYVDEYTLTHNKKNPNSTDIHSIKKVANIAAYVTKYMLKKHKSDIHKVKKTLYPQLYPALYQPNKISLNTKNFLRSQSNIGRMWSCSYELSNIKGGVTDVSDEIDFELKELKRLKDTNTIEKDYFTGIYYKQQQLQSLHFPILSSLLESYIRDKFGSSPSTLILNG